ncbi:uncharacterized protein [Diadema antillarum]|uniref:uncharacterized protein n=1 Tax=Diadema antillarum TaxID=105358 RepID=UPI003A860406
MSVGKSESLLRRDARAFCNKRHQRTIWEARRDERRTNQQLERELRLLERSRAYRERELDRDQVTFLNSFVDIFQRQCDIVAERKAQVVDMEPSNEDQEVDSVDADDSQCDTQFEDQETYTVTTSENGKGDDNSEITAVAQLNKKGLLMHRDSLLPIIYTPSLSEESALKYSSRPNSPRPVVTSPSELGEMTQESAHVENHIEQPSPRTGSPEEASITSASPSPPRKVQLNVSAPVYRRRLSPISRFKIPESHFRADSPSSKNSTIYVSDVPDLGESVRGMRMRRRTRIPPQIAQTNVKTSGGNRKSRQESRQKKHPGAADESENGVAAQESMLNTKFMLEFEEASRNALDPYATGTDIENIRKQFLVNTLAKKLKISALRSGHFAELDDIRKKIERRRKCVEEILQAKRKNRLAAAQAAANKHEAMDGAVGEEDAPGPTTEDLGEN